MNNLVLSFVATSFMLLHSVIDKNGVERVGFSAQEKSPMQEFIILPPMNVSMFAAKNKLKVSFLLEDTSCCFEHCCLIASC
jgi:hypothetical protein